MKTKVNIKGELIDLLAPFYLLPERKKKISSAICEPITSDHINDLARMIHPSKIFLKIKEIKDETPTTRTFRLVPDSEAGTDNLPFFRAGQYLSFKIDAGEVKVSRPYSISSTPSEALEFGYIDVTIRRKEGGFATKHIWENWSAGTKVESSGPCGFMYYDSLRDCKHIVGIAGGCGVTLFRSIIKDLLENDPDVRFTLLYGTKKPDDIVFKEELISIADKSPNRLKVHFICSEPDDSWNGPTGFLTADCILKFVPDLKDKTFFICGPQVMYKFLEKEMAALDIPHKRVRREVFGELEDVTRYPGFPSETICKTFEITVNIGSEIKTIPAISTETVVVSLERAGLTPPAQCRSGECGFCRSLLIKGDVFISPEVDGRRLADKKFGWFHPCSSYPISDLEIKVTRNI